MTKERFIQEFQEGLNAKNLAQIIGTSEGHVNELRRKPNAKAIAEAFNLDVEKVEEVLKKPNLEAIYDFMVNVKNVNDLTDEQIAQCKEKYKRPTTALKLEVGLETPFGKIIKVQKVGKTMIYLIGDNVYGTQELKDAFKKANNEIEVEE